ncbi:MULTISPECIES: transcriptional regulator [Haemophilus]|uniref:Phage repressor n=3 Tax=Haemophilus TaxID=724 RepID=A0ABY1VW60_HAEAE|nr:MULTISPECIES: transcriptional regulator [Haemophilus]EGF13985.1 DNA-binding protein [Haemophilus aegyptius ATCC 11116]OBX81092.1 transcriptional regulator [Haemophilus aegyptius]OBX84481.1 transcriptional regulator [Haemophilus aegyptius]TMQ46082.1 DNA-binding protein [Haemophilus influenzae biotype aegyptius]UAK83417.1 ORF6C domain-containing protein [Haemophilus aegyptius]
MELLITREDMGIRLIEERTRLGYSQANFAHQTDVSREALRLNEIGKSGISAEFLGRAAQLGVDVQYVIIGIRSANNVDCTDNVDKAVNNSSVLGDNNNVVYGSGTINNIKTEKVVTRTKATVEPDKTHINEKMARTLHDLVDEIVKLEKAVKQKPKSFQAVWSSLNRHCGVTAYRLIALQDYEKAELYLRKWVGRLNSSKSAPKKVGNQWRKTKYSYIHTNVKQMGIEPLLRQHLQEKYSAGSLTDLSDDQLTKVYQFIAGKKRTLLK